MRERRKKAERRGKRRRRCETEESAYLHHGSDHVLEEVLQEGVYLCIGTNVSGKEMLWKHAAVCAG